jgi:hypothetical protein
MLLSDKAELSMVSVAKQLGRVLTHRAFFSTTSYLIELDHPQAMVFVLFSNLEWDGGRGNGLMVSAFEHHHCFLWVINAGVQLYIVPYQLGDVMVLHSNAINEMT